jgi:hypothetical protein
MRRRMRDQCRSASRRPAVVRERPASSRVAQGEGLKKLALLAAAIITTALIVAPAPCNADTDTLPNNLDLKAAYCFAVVAEIIRHNGASEFVPEFQHKGAHIQQYYMRAGSIHQITRRNLIN